MIGSVVGGNYEIVELIGEGGMGAVYQATPSDGGDAVAVKVISDEEVAQDDVLVTRFEREAEAAAKVHSPHIVEIFASGHDDDSGHPYMVMELLKGENVLELLERLGPLPPELAIRVGIQTCRGLAKAHEVGVVHRDIKPANLFLHEAGDGKYVVKLLDFGVAKFKMDQAQASQNQSLTRTGSMLGSPMYMSPEQARGLKTIDHRADLWSLGIVLYQLLTGRQPHEEIEGLGELIITICSEPPELITVKAPWCSAELAQVIAGALKLSTDERYQTADDMAEALIACLEDPSDLGTIDGALLVELSEEQRASRPKDDGASPATSHDSTIALEDPDNPPGASQDERPQVPREVEEHANKFDVSLSDAKTIALERDDEPKADEAQPQSEQPPNALAADEPGGPPSSKMNDAQRAALDAAKLSSDEGSGSSLSTWLLVVAVLAAIAVAAFFAVGR